MNKHMNSRGVTLLEIMVVVAILVVVGGGIALLFTNSLDFFQRIRVRQKSMSEARQCVETIETIMRSGDSRTLLITTPTSGTPIVPNSRVDFEFKTPLVSGTTAYSIYLSAAVVYAMEFNPSKPNLAPRRLATNVSGLSFTNDSQDPSVLNVSLRIDAPYDPSRSVRTPSRMFTFILPNHTVRMLESR